MRKTHSTITHAAADADDLDVRAVIANVVADLLQAAQCRKVADGVGENRVAFHRQPGRQTGHILLRHADVEELLRKPGDKLVENGKAEIAAQKQDLRVLRSKLSQHTKKSVSHD